jgi:hypothetical protein
VSQFRVSVCLPPSSPGKVKAALTAALAPFDMNRPEEGNPDGHWDWWHIGAGDDRFAVKPPHDGDPRLIHQQDWPGGAPRERLPLRCDGGPRALLDFEAMRANVIAGARSSWQAEQQDWQRLAAGHPPALPLTAFLARHHADPQGYTREQATADHHSQPLIQALNHRPRDRYPNLAIWILGPSSDPISYYTRDPQPGLDLAAAWAIATFALLTTDGQWIEAGQPGPFGHALPGEDRSAAYARQATAYLDGLDGDYVVVRLLCHG